MLDTLAQDLRFGLRTLLRAPGFTAVALLTLALGIGANTAIFSVVHAVLWRPLRFAEPDRLVLLFRTTEGRISPSLSSANFLDTRARSRTLSGLVAFFTGGNGGTFTLTGQGDPLVVTATRVTDGFFDVLGIPAIHGRTFRRADNQPHQRVVILGYGLWRERFGADPKIVGRSLTLDGQSYAVVGIVPEDVYREFGQLWVPFAYDREFLDERDSYWLKGIGRVAPGQSIDAARREIETIGRHLAAEHRANTNRGMTAQPLHGYLVNRIRTAMLVLLGAAGFVLLIACANVANLVLVRAAHRESEMAIRAALGGTRARLLRQLVTESLVLAAGGGLLGVLLASWGTDLLLLARPAEMVFFDAQFDAQIDAAVLLFTLAVTVATGLTVGCIPAWHATRATLARTLKRGERGANVNRVRGALVVSEMALAVLLLIGAGLLIRSFIHLQRVEPGFQAERVLSFRLSLPDRAYDTGAKRVAFFDGLLARLDVAPGVESAAAATFAPMAGRQFSTSFRVTGRPALQPGQRQSMEVRLVTPGYFRTLGIPLRRGRLFTEADVEGARPVVVLSERAVREYFPNEDPLGRHIALSWGAVNGDVVGVVGDVKEMGLREPVAPQLYVVFAQAPRRNTMAVLLRTNVPPMSLANAVRREVRTSDASLAISDLETLDQVVAESVAHSRFYMLLLGTFATAALLLAAIGIFGVVSNAVAHRTREIGIRIALGAQASQVRGVVLRDAVLHAGLGIVLGIVASVPLTKLLATLLFELAPSDPLTLGGVVVVLLGSALVASYLPARRASRVDPVIALRAE